jgi:hypothetical protein
MNTSPPKRAAAFDVPLQTLHHRESPGDGDA